MAEAIKKRTLSVRVLPLALLGMAAFLTLKVTDVWNGFAEIGATVVTAGEAHAQTLPPAKSAAVPAQVVGGQAAGTAPATAPVQVANAPAGSQSMTQFPADPTRFSQSDIDLLQKLSERRDKLDKWEEQLRQREMLVQAAEKRLEEKMAGLETTRGDLMKLITRRNEDEDARLQSLVRIYEQMKPKEAAQILEKLDTDVVIGVVARMKEAKVAPILASMAPDRAKTVTTLLADRKDMPPKRQ